MTGKKVAKIRLGGKDRTFHFGMGFLGLFIENTTTTMESLEEDMSKNPFKVLPELMYYSLVYGFVRNDIKPDFSKYDVSDWIDENGGVDSASVKSFIDLLGKSMNPDLPKEKTVKTVGKQKK